MKSENINIVPIYHKETFVPGTLFCCPDEYLFIFETKHKAKLIANKKSYWSPLTLPKIETADYVQLVVYDYQFVLKEKIFFAMPGEMLLLLKNGGIFWSESATNRTFLKVLSGRTVGWIVVTEKQNLTLAENK